MRPGKLERHSCLRSFVGACVCGFVLAVGVVSHFFTFSLLGVNMAPSKNFSKHISQVLVLKDACYGTKEIRDLMNINPSTVRNWIRRRRQENSNAYPVPRKH